MNVQEASQKLVELPDEQLKALALVATWQYAGVGTSPGVDADGAPLSSLVGDREDPDRASLQALCWSKFHDNPQINTNVRGMMGRLTGLGFDVKSRIRDIQAVIEETEEDWRNRLYNYWPKYVARARMEGELFLSLTCHSDGFIEVDFLDPASLDGGKEGDGIIFHPRKATMPLAYLISQGQENEEIIPSVFLAKYPDLLDVLREDSDFAISKTKRSRKKAFAKLNGFTRFVVAWDQGFITRRNVSYLRTVLQWINYYEMLKQYEIDHKRSAGSFLWVATIADVNAFRVWLSLSDEDKRKTGLGAKKTPGGTIILPPGLDLKAVTPNLPRISEGDTDIMHMVTSGLNEPEDVTTGQSKGTFASVKASRGPMSDRVADEVAYFQRFLQFDFWASIFFLKSQIGSFPRSFKVDKVVDFANQKPVKEKVDVKPEKLITISFPKSEVIDQEAKARAMLGVKHGSTNKVLGIPNEKIAEEMGLGSYHHLRMQAAEEEALYPELLDPEDDEALQEKTEAEPGKKKKKA